MQVATAEFCSFCHCYSWVALCSLFAAGLLFELRCWLHLIAAGLLFELGYCLQLVCCWLQAGRYWPAVGCCPFFFPVIEFYNLFATVGSAFQSVTDGSSSWIFVGPFWFIFHSLLSACASFFSSSIAFANYSLMLCIS